MSRSSYAKQFKPGTYPDQHWDESEKISAVHDQDAPSKVRKRNGVSIGSQVNANPGLVPGIKKRSGNATSKKEKK